MAGNNGVVLAQTLIIITIIAIIAAGLLALSQSDFLLSRKSEEHLTDFYIEQAAIEKAYAIYWRDDAWPGNVTVDGITVTIGKTQDATGRWTITATVP